VVTVGYGDVYGVNTIEKLLCIFLMFYGVLFYSFTMGNVSAILANMNSKETVYHKKLNTLEKLKKLHHLDDVLFLSIKNSLRNE
jgi:hypothetical protein